MISKFATVYPGHVDMPDRGQEATPANERRFSNDQLAGVFAKTEAIAQLMDETGWDTLWLAEHHFQYEGYEVLLRQPQRIPAGLVHHPGNRLGLGEDAGQLVIGKAPFVCRGRVLASIGHIHMPGIHCGKFADHDDFLCPSMPSAEESFETINRRSKRCRRDPSSPGSPHPDALPPDLADAPRSPRQPRCDDRRFRRST